MTSLTTPAAFRSVDAASDDFPQTSAEASRREQQTLTERLLDSCSRCPDPVERQRLQQEVLLLNLRLADGIAAGYAGRGIERDDLVQVARLGLLKAIAGYRPGEGPGFTAYARPTISGEIKRYFRDHGWMVRPPRRLQEISSQLRVVEPDLEQQLNRAPSEHEVAHALVSQMEVSRLLRGILARLRDDLGITSPCGYRMTGVVTGNALVDPSDTSREVGENSRPWV